MRVEGGGLRDGYRAGGHGQEDPEPPHCIRRVGTRVAAPDPMWSNHAHTGQITGPYGQRRTQSHHIASAASSPEALHRESIYLSIRCILGDERLWVGDPSTASCLVPRATTSHLPRRDRRHCTRSNLVKSPVHIGQITSSYLSYRRSHPDKSLDLNEHGIVTRRTQSHHITSAASGPETLHPIHTGQITGIPTHPTRSHQN